MKSARFWIMEKSNNKKNEEKRGKSLSDYWPLIALIIVSGLAALALSSHAGFTTTILMHNFMGFFLCIFALLKLFNPSGFANGFQMYDLLAKQTRTYAYIYPLIELGLGLAYLAFWQPELTYILTVIVMFFGSVGVILALANGLDINCPCMGSILKVPLSTVTLTEDIGMGLMALFMLYGSMH